MASVPSPLIGAPGLEALLACAPDTVLAFDAAGRVVVANAMAARVLGRTDQTPGVCGVDQLVAAGAFEQELADAIADAGRSGALSTTWCGTMGVDRSRTFECRIVGVEGGGGVDGPAVALFARDVTSRVQLESTLRGLTEVDPLTGLLNHAAFHDRVSAALGGDSERASPAALILIDLDYLKQINDVHGHPAGDEAIRAVARGIRLETRSADLTARLGGDEFACLVERCDRSEIIQIAERIIAAVRASAVRGVGRLSASAGVAFVASTREPGDLFDRADRALYDAKASGRGVVSVGSDTDIAYASRRTDRPGRTDAPPVELAIATSRPEAARAALREWVHVLSASGGCIDLLDAERQSVRACTYYRFGHDDWGLAQESYRLDDYPNTARAIARRETYTCRVDDPDADPAETALLRERGFASLLLTPLVAGDAPIGIVELFDTRHRTFTTDDQRVALSLASHLSAVMVRLPAE